MARLAATYRGARRNAARRAKLDWRNGRETHELVGIRLATHASLTAIMPGFLEHQLTVGRNWTKPETKQAASV